MDVGYFIEGTGFEWDADKARSNRVKHGVTFEEAAEVFFDPFCQFGDASIEAEIRDFALGYSAGQRSLLVIHLQRAGCIRLISARLATRAEKKLYEDQ